jgi:hypothetical protein
VSADLPQPDFLRPAAGPARLAWAWCATGLLVLAFSALDSHAAWQARTQALARMARSAAPPANATSLAPTTRPDAARSAAQARQAEAKRWQQQLALPWPAVWSASEAAPPGVQWLQFDHASATGLRLTGLATGPAPAEAVAEALRAQDLAGAPVWQGVAVATLERVPEGQRFELVARLVPGPAGTAPTAGRTP